MSHASPSSIHTLASANCTCASRSDFTSVPRSTMPGLDGVEDVEVAPRRAVGGDHLSGHRRAGRASSASTWGWATLPSAAVLRLTGSAYAGHDRPRLRRPARRGVRAAGRRPLGDAAGVARFDPCRQRRPSRRRSTRSTPATTCGPTATPRTDGLEIIGVMHCHTHTDAYPSPTDVAQAPDPAWHYVIVSLRDEAPDAALATASSTAPITEEPVVVDAVESDRRSAFPTEPLGIPTIEPDRALRLRPRPHRQHADGRRQPRSAPTRDVRILAKLEGQNPGGSVKDRVAKYMIDEAEKDGILQPGPDDHRVVVGQHRHRPGDDRQDPGLPAQDRAARERVDRAPPAARGVGRRDHPVARRRRAPTAPCAGPRPWPTSTPSGAFPYQYGNEANPRAHYEGTGPEIWRDCPEITHFVAGLGTAGTLMGVGTFLKEQNPDVQIWAIEPPAGRDGRRACKNLDEGFIPPVFLDKGRLRPARPQDRSCGPASRSSGPAGSPRSASSPASRRAPSWPAAAKCAERDRRGRDRAHRLRRRLEVPLHRRLDRRHRRRRSPGQGHHLLLDVRDLRCGSHAAAP